MARPKSPLGRGLESVLPSAAPYSEGFVKGNVLRMIPLDRIEVNPYQPRGQFDEEALTELTESIRRHGVIQPVTVRSLPDGRYQIISGERRVRAARAAGLKHIPAYVRDTDDNALLELALIENIQRADLNPIEIALAYQRMIEELGISQEEVARRVGKKRSSVTNYLRLLKLSPAVQRAVLEGKISMGHARALAGVQDEAAQEALLDRILAEGLSVRQLEKLLSKGRPSARARRKTSRLKEWEAHLSRHWDTPRKVEVRKTPKGKLAVRLIFDDEKDLARFIDRLDD